MAINLDFTAAGVERFQKEDPMREGRIQLQRQQVVDRALGAAGRAIQQRDELKNEREMQMANLTLNEAETARLSAADNRLYYSGDELPDDIKVRGGRTVKQNGVDVPRQIPRFEIEPDLLRSQEMSALNDSASQISNRRLRNQFIASNREQIENQYQRRIISSLAEGRQQMKAELVGQVSALSLDGNFFEARQMVKDSSLLTDSQKAEANADLRKGEEVYDIKDYINRQNLSLGERDQIDKMIVDLQSETYSGELSQEERIGLQNSLKQKLSQDQSEKDAEFFRERGQQVSNLYVGIAKGDTAIDEQSIQNAFDDGILTSSEMTSMKKQLIDKRGKLEKEYASRREYTMRIENNAGLDPNNPEYKRFVDEDFDEALNFIAQQTGGEVTPEQFYTVGIQSMRRTGIAPSQIIAEIRGANRNDAEALMLAADAYNGVIDYAPQSLNDFPEHATSLVSSVAARKAMGLSSVNAVQSALEDRDLSAGEREVRKTMLREAKKTNKAGRSAITTDLRDKLNGDEVFQIPFKFSDTAPSNASQGRMQQDDLPIEMVGQYEALIESYLPIEGYNMSAAGQKAFQELKRSWAITNINSPDTSVLAPGQRGFQLMPYAPKGDAQLMHNDLQRQMAPSLSEGETAILSYDFITIRQGDAGQPVTYPAWRVDADGTPFLLAERWSWDQESATAAQNKIFLKEAQEKRDLLTKRNKDMRERVEKVRVSREEAVRRAGRRIKPTE